MQIVNLIQRSPEWHAWRSSKITASMCPVIMGVSPWQTPNQLWRELCLGEKRDVYTPAIERGQKLEDACKIWTEHNLELNLKPICVESLENPLFAASLDGYDFDKNIVAELKCPGKESHKKMANGEIPQVYFYQVQWQLMVTKAQFAYLVSFDGFEGAYIKIEPCETTFKEMKKKCLSFWKYVEDFEEFPLSDSDFIEESSPEWLYAEEIYIQALEAKRQAEYEIKACKAKFEAIANSRVRLKSPRLRYFQTVCKGPVDWELLMQEKKIEQADCEVFRKPPIVKTNLRVI